MVIGNDRLLAPNTEETFEQFKPVLSEVLTPLFDSSDLTLTHQKDPQERFAVVAKTNQVAGNRQTAGRAFLARIMHKFSSLRSDEGGVTKGRRRRGFFVVSPVSCQLSVVSRPGG